MAWVDFTVQGFEWVGPAGEPRWYRTWPTTSRGFCPDCGSTVAALDDGGTAMGVTMMSLDDRDDLITRPPEFQGNSCRVDACDRDGHTLRPTRERHDAARPSPATR
jgi:hypothetical protein